MSDRHPDSDELIELALGWADGPEAAELTGHLDACTACRASYAAIDASVLTALTAAPSIAPPAGFSGRALAAMGIAEPSAAAKAERISPRQRRWSRRLLVAVAAVFGLIAGATGTWFAVDAIRPESVGAGVLAAPLVTGGGETVGTVGRTRVGGRNYLVVTVTGGRPGISYECVLVKPDGSRVSGGSWTLSGSSGTWLVEVTGASTSRVEMIVASGRIWSHADLA